MNINENLIKKIILLSVYSLFILMFWPFKTALLFASLIAFALSPLIQRFQHKIKNEKLLVLTVVTAFMAVFFIPLSIITIQSLIKINQLSQQGLDKFDIYNKVDTAINYLIDQVNLVSQTFHFDLLSFINLKTVVPFISQSAMGFIGQLAGEIPQFSFQFVIFISSLYIFIFYRKNILRWFLDQNILPTSSVHQLVQFFKKTCYTVVVSTLLVASVQAVIITFALLIAGFDEIFLLFMFVFFMSFIPVIGSAPISLSLAIYCFIQGQVMSGIVIVVAAIIASVSDNVIKTVILSSEGETVHPYISLLSLVGAMIMFGFSGLFLGPIVSQLAFSIHSFLKSHIIHEEIKQD